jgi:hypothetical protein
MQRGDIAAARPIGVIPAGGAGVAAWTQVTDQTRVMYTRVVPVSLW